MSERFIARVLLQTCNKVITRVLVVGVAFLLGYHGTSLLYCSVPSNELRVRAANKDWSFSPSNELRVRAANKDWSFSPSRRHLLASNDSGSNYPPDIFSLEQRRQGAVILHIFGMVYMFLALAVVCDEFFVPALGVITRKLHISDDVSGATFMAAGGSAPELFTSFIGVFIANSDVGIGTIVGSAVFNILFVIGVCALVSKDALRLTWWPLFRDVTFYSVSLLILIAFFYDGKIYWWEALILFLLYVAYVVFMKYTHIIEAKVKVYICRSNSVNSMAIPEQTTRHIPFLPANSALTGRFRHGVLQLLLHSIDPFSQVKVQEKSTHFPTPDILQIVTDHEATLNYISSMSHNNKGQEAIHEYISTISHNRNEGATLACKGNISLDNRNEGATLDCNINISHNNRNEGATLDCKSNTSLDNKNDGATLDWKSNISLDNKDQGAAFAFNSSNKFQVDKDQGVTLSYSSNISQTDKEQVINRDYNSVVSPLQENDKQPSQDILQRDANANQKEPTVPMNENTEPWDPDSKSEVTPDDEEPLDLSWPKTCASRTSFVFLAPIVFPLWVTLPDVRRQEKRKFFVLTFIGSVLWIAFFSYLMVWWANQSGETIGIPDGIMGLTILAAGTSIPDLITSVIVTKKGLGDMAVSSSLGSNIFDITVGLPLPWLMYGAVNGGAAYRVNSTGLLCSIVLLFVMLVAVIATIAVCRWRMSKLLGLTMLVLYVVFIVLSVLLEMEIIKCPV